MSDTVELKATTKALLERLRTMDIFARAGEVPPTDLPKHTDVRSVRSWSEACRLGSLGRSIDFFIGDQNEWTWQAQQERGAPCALMVAAHEGAKELVLGPIKQLALTRVKCKAKFVETAMGYAMGNLIGAVMAEAWSDYHDSKLYIDVLAWYFAGHYPCSGVVEDGRKILYVY